MTGIKHATQTTKTNNSAYDVSATAWNQEHTKGTTGDVLTDHNLETHTSLGLEKQANKDTANGYAGLDSDAKVPAANLKIPLQTIDGPDWTDPTGNSQIVIQINTAANLTAFCWYDGVTWHRVINQVGSFTFE
jgi:hypothetical protein